EIAPVASAQNIVAELDAEGFATIAAEDADNGSSDNCSIASRELNITEFSCENLGEQEVIMTVIDASGNENQASFTVTVVDQVAPVIPEELSINVYLDEDGIGIFDTAPLLAEASDNCGLSHIADVEMEMDIDGFPFDCEMVGQNAGPLLAVDVNGNSTPFILQLNVMDTISPTFDLAQIELMIDEEGNAFLSEDMLMEFAGDNCGIAEVAIQVDEFDCSLLGESQFTEIIVFDLHGNFKQQTLEVQLIDNMAPEVQVEDITIELGADGFASLSSDALDMMIQDNCTPEDFQLSQEAFSCEDLGSSSLMISVTDASGNNGSAQFNVTVVDNVAPQIEGPQVIQVCQGTSVSYDAIVASDNCSAELIIVQGSVEVDVNTPGEYMIQAQAFDPSGNIASRDIMVVVEPAAVVDLGEDMEVVEGAEITLVAGENNANEYLWSTGETGPVYQFVATEDVVVSVEVITPDGCSTTDEISITIADPLSLDNDAEGNSVRFFPNPTSGNVSLELGLNKTVTNLQITIMDISGKAIDQKMIPAAQNGQVINLDLSQAAKGVYLVNVKADDFSLTERIVKQ
ncbi:MAG: T9SS type A sorting domain-containing protein, partial [Cryomorphaceae bacterium]